MPQADLWQKTKTRKRINMSTAVEYFDKTAKEKKESNTKRNLAIGAGGLATAYLAKKGLSRALDKALFKNLNGVGGAAGKAAGKKAADGLDAVGFIGA